MKLQIGRNDIKTLKIPAGTTLFRVNANSNHKFQPADKSKVLAGRFNDADQYTFYMAANPIAAVLEYYHWHHESEKPIFLHEYRTKRMLHIASFNRWDYAQPPGIDYSPPEILINQFITCPNVLESPHPYYGTRLVAKWCRQRFQGLAFQTSVAHYLANPSIYKTPCNLINYALFKSPAQCEELLEYLKCEPTEVSEEIKHEYQSVAQKEFILKRIQVKNSSEGVAGLIFRNEFYVPSLPLFKLKIGNNGI